MLKFSTIIYVFLCGLAVALLMGYVYEDIGTGILCFLIIPCAYFSLTSSDDPGNTTITKQVADNPELLALKRKNILQELSLLESARTLQGTVFEASTELVGLTDENDARERFTSTLNIYWSAEGLDLFVWERGHWHSLGGKAHGDEPVLTGPVQLPELEEDDLVLDLSPGVDGQAALILRRAKPQPTISGRSEADQRYIAEVLRGQLVLSLRRVKLYKRLQELGRTDPLTTVTRRWYGMERLEEHLQTKENTCIALIDIDYFKKINDNHGHQSGDTVLRAVGATLNKSLRTGDIACRYGGEEFLIVLPRTSSISGRDVAERIRASIATLADLPCEVTVSIGVCSAGPYDTCDTAIERADSALYEAKDSGRNQVILAADVQDVHSTNTFRKT